MSMPVFIVIILIVAVFGLGMAFAGRIYRHNVEHWRSEYEKAAAGVNLINAEQAEAIRVGQLVAELADGIEHACEFFADGDVDQAKYVVFGLDDRLKTRKRQ